MIAGSFQADRPVNRGDVKEIDEKSLISADQTSPEAWHPDGNPADLVTSMPDYSFTAPTPGDYGLTESGGWNGDNTGASKLYGGTLLRDTWSGDTGLRVLVGNKAPVGLNGHGYLPQVGDNLTLARMMFAESSNIPGDYDAIGWTIVNRVGNREFGATLDDVLYQTNGFQIVEQGGGPKGNSPQWNMSAHPETMSGANLKSWNEAVSTANGILDGKIADPTGGASFFFSSTKYDGTPATAPGGFRSMMTRGTITPSSYTSQSTGKAKNYFFVEVRKPK